MLSQSALARRLEQRVAEDARLRAIEAAKKDAVARRVDVDTFQALVSAAHLRPMRGGLRLAPGAAGSEPAAPRHFRPDGTLTGSSGPSVLSNTAAAPDALQASVISEAALRSGALFVRAWRAAAPCGRMQLLRRAVEVGALPRLLRLELSSRLLEEVVECLVGAAAAGGLTASGMAAEEGEQLDEGAAAAGASSPVVRAAGAAHEHSDHVVRAVLQAAEAASSYAVAQAGLSLQARQRLAGLKAALQ